MEKLVDTEIEPIHFNFKEYERVEIDEEIYAYSFINNEGGDIILTMNKNFVYFFISDCESFQLKMQSPESDKINRRGDILLFANPYANTDLYYSSDEKECELQVLALSMKKLHSFFGNSFGEDPEAVQDYLRSFRMKQYFTIKSVNPEVLVLFHQIFNNTITGFQKGLYLQGKVLEIMSYYLQKPQHLSELEQQCPFIADDHEMKRVREARDLMIKDIVSPPTLKELAKAVGTNEFKLKIGFKNMYGNTIYAYLTDYRMEHARKLLISNSHNVKAISHKIGYSNPSHFIAAYKKKFGITPKRHVKNH